MAPFILAFVWAIAGFHLAATYFAWYYAFPWIDIPMHIAGGAWIAALLYYLAVDRLAIFTAGEWRKLLFFGVATVALVGVAWEFYEILLDLYVLKAYTLFDAPGGLHFDTLKDLFDDLAGGAVMLSVLVRRRR